MALIAAYSRIERLDEGEYRLRRLALSPNEGLVAWLPSSLGGGLPEFDPRSKSTDSFLLHIQWSIWVAPSKA